MELTKIINQLGEEHEKYFNAVAPPIIQTSNFCYSSVEDMRNAIINEFDEPVYTRGNNPTVEILRKKLAALEKADDCLVTASGVAAITTSVIANLEEGDHVICVNKPYSWTNHFFSNILKKFGIETTFIDGTDIENFKAALKSNTTVFYLESPNSWTFELQDLKLVSQLAKKSGIITIIDNSYSTPLYQNPIEYGIDIVVHSASKYLSGHSDIVAGVICSNNEMIRKIFNNEFMTFGGIIAPFNAWLMIRGLRTLELRLDKSSDNAHKVIDFLANHPKIEKIIYPHHPSHPQYELALKQMKNSSGLFSVYLKTNDPKQIEKVCENLEYFKLAVSWGGYESLIFPAIATYNPSNSEKSALPVNMIRIYTGLERPNLLIADLDRALLS
jgi:cystathionine beta-lyase